MNLIGLVHKPSANLAQCQLTFIDREPIDYQRALLQHERYCQALTRCGVDVQRLCVNPDSPDSVFIEDCAVVLGELAIIGSMGSVARRSETGAVSAVLSQYRKTVPIELPAQLEGGDVLNINRTLYAGLSQRTNRAGIDALAKMVTPLGYSVVPVRVPGSLHLKTAITALDSQTLLCNREWLDISAFSGFKVINVAAGEPFAANVIALSGQILMNANCPQTIANIERLGYDVLPVEISEFSKAEAGLTCMSLIF